ncbi:hypothetical protein GCM10010275_35000 [Streptomyces litmocidini]|uniref:hypothetical protein n=1 Tax=Streptomyces litmocidini TaxID=67318 RepID=UPI00167D0F31|nr:hypothetical protein [Streptomyces litmocidini]GGU94437.1 hypothetical protein GCM10010275_35000 [Streptomyces litmocidini]
MTFDARRGRRLQHVTATGSALAVALGPLVLGALLARSVGGDPMASVNALIAGGGQRARISRAQLRSGARLRPRARPRSRGAVPRPGSVARRERGARRGSDRRLRSVARPGADATLARSGSAARPARREEGLRRLLPGARLPYGTGRPGRTRRTRQGRETVG